MKKLIATTGLVVLGALAAFAQKDKGTEVKGYPQMKYRDFVPIEPIEYQEEIELFDENKTLTYKYIKSLNKKELQAFLTNETVLVSVAQVDKEGNLTYSASRISEKNIQYIVTMDYLKYATTEIRHEGDITGDACVGVGLRIVANISSRADDINLGDLFAIGMAVSNKSVYGSLRVTAIGMHDPEITAVIPLPSEISAAAIQSVMQAMSVIKYKIYDQTTELAPQIVGIRAVKEGVSMEDLNTTVLRHHIQGRRATQPQATDGGK